MHKNYLDELAKYAEFGVMEWELENVGTSADEPAMVDDVYVTIHRVETLQHSKGYSNTVVTVRVDLMGPHEPIQSFIGIAYDVRRRLCEYLRESDISLTMDHMAYIGYELCRAEYEEHYKQD